MLEKNIKIIYIAAAVLVFGFLISLNMDFKSNSDQMNSPYGEQDVEINHINNSYEKITFAGGCFWCIEAALQENDGVISAISGYSGGLEKNAKYLSVVRGNTRHRESVQVTFDPEIISAEELVKIFFAAIDPTDDGGQFADRGFHYTTAIFYHDEGQKNIALSAKEGVENSGLFEKEIVTKIIPFESFYEAEEYHQDYYKKSSDHYKRYEKASGRAGFVEENWAKDAAIEFLSKELDSDNDEVDFIYDKNKIYSSEEIKKLQEKLSEKSYDVLVHDETERAFSGEYWNSKEKGIYVDPVTKEPLFASIHKYDSGTGWPSFYETISENLIEKKDTKLLYERIEVRSRGGHLGHIFDDGPKDKTGLRYCINSAALEFVPYEKMETLGYGELLEIFEKENS